VAHVAQARAQEAFATADVQNTGARQSCRLFEDARMTAQAARLEDVGG
jgi:hypothetical protein